eukprot:GGOE01065253.1.p1 GENE.GGOE01065253.1~~GGOE01065253.1.p1  ORF type:complete len:225 (+),score=18.87 GGOE01065253.1:75-749(+)
MGCAHRKGANADAYHVPTRNPQPSNNGFANASPAQKNPFQSESVQRNVVTNAQTGDLRARRTRAFKDEFRFFDQNKDGCITQDDIAECLVQFGIDALSVQAPAGQGPISEEQYLSWRGRVCESAEFLSSLDNVFCFSDGDYDGAITKEDLATLTSLWTPAPSAEVVEQMIRQVDWKGSRDLDCNHFKRMMKGETEDGAPNTLELEQWMARWRCLNILYLPGYFA